MNFFEGDIEKLMEFYGENKAGHVVRTIVRGHIKKIEARAARAREQLDIDINIGE